MMDLIPYSQVLTFDCSYIHWITSVYGFLESTINKSINQSKSLVIVCQQIAPSVNVQLYSASSTYLLTMPLDGSEKSPMFLPLCLTGNETVVRVMHCCQMALHVKPPFSCSVHTTSTLTTSHTHLHNIPCMHRGGVEVSL
jgi:hypothetical protein